MRETLDKEGGSMSGDDDFFSVARTMPFVAELKVSFIDFVYSREAKTCITPLIPREVTPWLTALRAYSDPLQKSSLMSYRAM